jgi:hypothetical protein
MSNMSVPDALRIASIFEADDIISVPAMACRILAKYVQYLEQQHTTPDVMFHCVAKSLDGYNQDNVAFAILDAACGYDYITEEQRDIAKRQMDTPLQK